MEQIKDSKLKSLGVKAQRSFQLGGQVELVQHRIRSGWSEEEAMSIPKGMRRHEYYLRDKIYQMWLSQTRIRVICAEVKLSYPTVRRIIERKIKESGKHD